jgi:hypothetical protein
MISLKPIYDVQECEEFSFFIQSLFQGFEGKMVDPSGIEPLTS